MKRITLLLACLFVALAISPGVIRTRAMRSDQVSARIVYFTARPRVIRPGDSVTLAWETRGATSVAMEWGPEYHERGTMQKRTGLPPSGSITVQPEADTVFVLECDTAQGVMCMSASTRVRIK